MNQMFNWLSCRINVTYSWNFWVLMIKEESSNWKSWVFHPLNARPMINMTLMKVNNIFLAVRFQLVQILKYACQAGEKHHSSLSY